MYYSFTGRIIAKGKGLIAIDVHDVAYDLLVSREEDFALDSTMTVFAYEAYSETDHYLVGFASTLEKSAFLSLISVKGIGPKTALNALAKTTPSELFSAIKANNTAYLKKLPGIGPKAASQIILDLKGHLELTDEKGDPKRFDEVKEALKNLGFKNKEIDDALAKITEPDLSNEAILRLALKSLGKGLK